jgi:hypothetical protein
MGLRLPMRIVLVPSERAVGLWGRFNCRHEFALPPATVPRGPLTRGGGAFVWHVFDGWRYSRGVAPTAIWRLVAMAGVGHRDAGQCSLGV